MQDQGHLQPTGVPLRKWEADCFFPADVATALTACLGKLSVGCISSCMLLTAQITKCTALEDPVHTEMDFSKAAGFLEMLKDMFCH